MDHDAITPSSAAGLDVAALRCGDQVTVDGRPAVFAHLMPSRTAAVIRYPGEQRTRVVALRKLHRAGRQAS